MLGIGLGFLSSGLLVGRLTSMGSIRRLRTGYSPIGINDGRPEKEKDSWCQRCLNAAGVFSHLKNRIYLDEEGKPTTPGPDADKWVQCWRCGDIIPVFAAKQEAQIVTLTEPTDNPFDKSEVMGIGGKKDRVKRLRQRGKKQDLSYIKEDDVRRAVAKGATLIEYHES